MVSRFAPVEPPLIPGRSQKKRPNRHYQRTKPKAPHTASVYFGLPAPNAILNRS